MPVVGGRGWEGVNIYANVRTVKVATVQVEVPCADSVSRVCLIFREI